MRTRLRRLSTRSAALAGALGALAVIVAFSLLVRLAPDGEPGAVVRTPDTPRLVFAEFGLNEDRIYTAPADAPQERTLHASVPHAPGWGLNPAATAAGSLVAYTVLPEDAEAGRATPAELWVLDVTTDNLTRLARDADLLAPPVFVDDGRALIYRRSLGATQEVVQVEMEDRTREVLHAEQTSFGVFPIGLHDGALVFARLSTQGTDIYRVAPGAAPEWLFHASDDIARDWRISPDGGAISFLAPVAEAERVVYRARVFSLRTFEAIPIGADAEAGAAAGFPSEQYGPVWTPDGDAVTVGQEAADGPAAPALTLGLDGSREALPAPDFGFDVPLAWSDDGRFLVVRSFDGRSSVNPGLQRTVVIDREGGRYTVDVSSEVIVLGWYSGA